MSKPQNSSKALFVDYIPAELKENKVWIIEYYVKNPFTEELQRKRFRVKPLKNITERRKLGKRMVAEVNKRLESGWNPFYQNKGTKELTKVVDALSLFMRRTKREYDDANVRYDTYKTYRSQCAVLESYLLEVIEKPDLLCYQLDEDFVGNYLDHVRYDKGLSARTRDNYLGFLGTLCAFLISKKYMVTNPTQNFHKINRKEKRRTLIDKPMRSMIFDYWQNRSEAYLVLCMVCYYCLIRRTELTKITVSDISLSNSTLWIDGSDSKNRKSKHVTIPDKLMPFLANHIKSAKNADFLFSANEFQPGQRRLRPDRITRNWEYMRKDLQLGNEIHWYSLKDSGITDLLAAGVPLISVRDQARHHSSAQTDAYTPRKILKANQNIRTADI
ncbi:Site-specific recombinase XerD [Maribacter dokdonensis]|uniref:Site-specific recombinase XerD n=1 Tax=Maribacter dokdonensis TaxID=320912 RepID=A0ABY0UTM2_9FLAO|nr:site-specific integrase [Maribacter dokdonensis]SDT16463.1 Site-specific recombinase XerD [Maribacter dokdonensis]